MKERIIQETKKQVSKFGFRRFTIDDVAFNLGISKKTIYKYFDSKRQLISAVIDSWLEREKERTLQIMESDDNWLEKLQKVIFYEIKKQIPLWMIAELQRFFPEEWSKTNAMGRFKHEQLRKLLRQGIEEGDIRSDLHPAVIELVIYRSIHGLFETDFLILNNLTVNQVKKEIKKIILHGILKKDTMAEERGEKNEEQI
ncbi:AcrR family transcriptional regulator [Desulfohalotomaculum tongense]|uniref:TetR/AcrR family transcriptional regulator n=1 Tax=Desulforadius tongensis TaxID=1216062 RepID=UPI00195714EC|nr:TetR/AcrR family transcriptional regulator [Desulforadius tongensis]MBM7856146.1 AcrR family transcriptional regulator [Desulforadius tongensis]